MGDGVPAVAPELPVLEDVAVEFVADFVEVVHVELPHERTEVLVPEVDWQDLLLEAFHVHDREVRAILVPAGDVDVCLTLTPFTLTSKMSNVFEMKMDGPLAFSLRPRPPRRSSSPYSPWDSTFYSFYGRCIPNSKLILNTPAG